jgi:SAM-dependent methyltransferase
LAGSEIYSALHHWGSGIVDVDRRDLPALKARYLLDALPGEGRVVELGCGGGRLLNTVAAHRPALDLFGCDIRPLDNEPGTFCFSLVSPTDDTLPYEPASVDAVIAFDVLEHVLEPAVSLRAIRTVLRPGGRLISFTPLEGQPYSWYALYRRLFGERLYVDTKEHIHAFTEDGLCTMVRRELTITDHAYAYHALGQFMDATLFAAMKVSSVRRRFWDENPFYQEDDAVAGAPSLFGRALRAANALAYAESRLLRHQRFGAAGLLFTARRDS